MASIREISPDDWPAFRDIRLTALADAPAAFGSTLDEAQSRSDQEWEALVRERCASDRSAIWLAERPDDDVVGVVAAFVADSRLDVELISMWVAPKARGEGLAKRLIDVVVAWAGQAEASTVSLWVTRGNDPAQRLYESAGFVVTGDHQALPSDPCKDEIRMVRTI